MNVCQMQDFESKRILRRLEDRKRERELERCKGYIAMSLSRLNFENKVRIKGEILKFMEML